MFEDIAKTWLNTWFNDACLAADYKKILDDLVLTLVQIYEAGRAYGYEEGLQENLTELQW